MDQELTEIVVVADRSGSMADVLDDTIGGFNTFLEAQQKSKVGKCLLTYIQFDTEYEVVQEALPVEQMKPLDRITFMPRGGTALYDALGKAIDDVGERLSKTPEEKRPGAVIFVIMTDGQENSSSPRYKDRLREMIKHQTETYNWTFIFLGQNIDAFQAGASMGMSNTNSHVFVANVMQGGTGQRSAYQVATSAILSSRHRVSKGGVADFSLEQRRDLNSILDGTGTLSSSLQNPDKEEDAV